MAYVITDHNEYLIRPKDIDASAKQYYSKLFGEYGTEIMAVYVVELCRKLHGWKPFTKTQIVNFLVKNHYSREEAFTLFCKLLVSKGFVVFSEADKKYRVTHEFVTACWDAAPAGVSRFSS